MTVKTTALDDPGTRRELSVIITASAAGKCVDALQDAQR